jgi:hypothetical protein
VYPSHGRRTGSKCPIGFSSAPFHAGRAARQVPSPASARSASPTSRCNRNRVCKTDRLADGNDGQTGRWIIQYQLAIYQVSFPARRANKLRHGETEPPIESAYWSFVGNSPTTPSRLSFTRLGASAPLEMQRLSVRLSLTSPTQRLSGRSPSPEGASNSACLSACLSVCCSPRAARAHRPALRAPRRCT